MNSYSFYGDILPGEGEDANPICSANPNEEIVFAAAVLDGLGGSGCQKYAFNGKEYTGAALASKLVRSRLVKLFESGTSWNQSLSEIADFLHEEIFQLLSNVEERLDNGVHSNSRLKTKLIKKFPTTLALAYVTSNNSLRLFWAGNSRIYRFNNKNRELNFISIDDAKEIENDINNEDSMKYMLSHKDYPMSNCINLATDFFINYAEYEDLAPNDIIIVATDGVYGCFKDHNEFQDFIISNCLIPEFNLKPLEDFVKNNRNDDYSLSSFKVDSFQGKAMSIENDMGINNTTSKRYTVILSLMMVALFLSVTTIGYYLNKMTAELKMMEANTSKLATIENLQIDKLKKIEELLEKLVSLEEIRVRSMSHGDTNADVPFPTINETKPERKQTAPLFQQNNSHQFPNQLPQGKIYYR